MTAARISRAKRKKRKHKLCLLKYRFQKNNIKLCPSFVYRQDGANELSLFDS